MTKLARCVLALALALGVAPNVLAASYTTQSAFLDNVEPDYYLETFDSIALGDNAIPNPSTFDDGTYSYELSTTSTFYGLDGGGSDRWLSVFDGFGNLVFNNFGSDVTAIGGYFFATDLSGSPTSAQVTATLNNGEQLQLTTSSSTNFFGFTTTAPITSLTVVTTNNDYVTVNDLIVGTAIPEPVTVGLGLVGLMGLVARRRRKA